MTKYNTPIKKVSKIRESIAIHHPTFLLVNKICRKNNTIRYKTVNKLILAGAKSLYPELYQTFIETYGIEDVSEK